MLIPGEFSAFDIGNSILCLQPEHQNIVKIGDNATFTCHSPNLRQLANITWLINGSSLEENPRVDVNSRPIESDDRIVGGLLKLTNLSYQYDMTSIQCRAEFSDDTTSTTEPSILIITEEGELVHVGVLVMLPSYCAQSHCCVSFIIPVSSVAMQSSSTTPGPGLDPGFCNGGGGGGGGGALHSKSKGGGGGVHPLPLHP